ncbi:MAG: 4-(cytidine 5'-diphospho)-2-C-methyl-D-erythritol kinase [Bacteroidales bacterium]
MTFFPNVKINLGLRIISGRDDGYHNIESIFYPVALTDALEFVTDESGSDSDSFTQTGHQTGCPMSDNLAVRALNLLRRRYNIPPLIIHLHKKIPVGAGLGGGSSDAAFMLRYLNRYFRLGLCNNDLTSLALELGSDCTFFIMNRPALATGRGEILEPLDPLQEKLHILIVNPGININTGQAYSRSTPAVPVESLQDLYALPVEQWRGRIVNDFESIVTGMHPEIGVIRDNLYSLGALYASMSGSGSSFYGIFRDFPPPYKFNPSWFSWRGIMGIERRG